MFHHKEGRHTQKSVSHKERVKHKKGVHILHFQRDGTHTLLSYVDQARDQHSIAKAGLVTEEKERTEENHTIFLPTKQKNSQVSRN